MTDWGIEEWMDSALCAQVGGDDWFPERGTDMTAKNICDSCPVANQCLTYSIEHGIMHGTWGGVPEKKRRRIIAKRNRTEVT